MRAGLKLTSLAKRLKNKPIFFECSIVRMSECSIVRMFGVNVSFGFDVVDAEKAVWADFSCRHLTTHRCIQNCLIIVFKLFLFLFSRTSIEWIFVAWFVCPDRCCAFAWGGWTRAPRTRGRSCSLGRCTSREGFGRTRPRCLSRPRPWFGGKRPPLERSPFPASLLEVRREPEMKRKQ